MDGGNFNNPPLKKPANFPSNGRTWTPISINNGDLFVADTDRVDKGLMYEVPKVSHTPFIRLPRKYALEKTNMLDINNIQAFLSSLQSACDVQNCQQKGAKERQSLRSTSIAQ